MLSGRSVRLDDCNSSLGCHRAECTRAVYTTARPALDHSDTCRPCFDPTCTCIDDQLQTRADKVSQLPATLVLQRPQNVTPRLVLLLRCLSLSCTAAGPASAHQRSADCGVDHSAVLLLRCEECNIGYLSMVGSCRMLSGRSSKVRRKYRHV
jgi:hypothetical protein